MLTKRHRLLHQPRARWRVGFFCRTLHVNPIAWCVDAKRTAQDGAPMLLCLCSGPRATKLMGERGFFRPANCSAPL